MWISEIIGQMAPKLNKGIIYLSNFMNIGMPYNQKYQTWYHFKIVYETHHPQTVAIKCKTNTITKDIHSKSHLKEKIPHNFSE